MRSSVAILATATLVGALVAGGAGAATRSAATCNPAYEYCDPGALPAGAYTTQYFLPGMRVRLPSRGWSSPQDSTNELRLHPPGYSDATFLRFWTDPRLSTACSDRVISARITTPAQAVRWFRSNKELLVSPPRQATIAGHVAALTIDVDLSPTAPRCGASCPGPCIDYFLFFGGTAPDATDLAPGHTPGAKDGFGSARGELVRFYFAEIRKPARLFVVGVDTYSKKDFAALTPVASTLLAKLHLPS
ncbi:MAG TPA: hypothetical protein VF091_00245 [Gaiellaceae bacterium]